MIEAVRDELLDSDTTGVSVYEVAIPHRYDLGHALGVVASTINSRDFAKAARDKIAKHVREADLGKDQKQQPDAIGRNVASFILPWEPFSACCTIKSTPDQNLEFGAADCLHWDLSILDLAAFTRAFVNCVRTSQIRWSFLLKPDYRVQAAIALAGCLIAEPSIASRRIPSWWKKRGQLEPTEQLDRLMCLAADDGYQARI